MLIKFLISPQSSRSKGPNLIQMSVIVTEIDALNAVDVYLITSRGLTPGLNFWSCGHRRMAMLPIMTYNLVQIALSNSELLTFFPKFKMAAAAILDFQAM